MNDNQEKLLEKLELRIKQLIFLCDSLKEKNLVLEKELISKNEIIGSLNNQIQQLKKQYDNLKFVKALTSENKEEINSAKQQLSKLVRDVDKCIALLKI